MNIRDQTLGRMYVVLTILALLPLIIAGRLIWLNVDQGEDLRELGWHQAESQQILLPQRGGILDIRGRALAVNSPRYNLALDPTAPGFDEEKTFFLIRLENLTGTSTEFLEAKIENRSSKQFVRLLDLSPDQRREVAQWNIPGVILEERSRRQYVYGTTASHILGQIDRDGVGKAGLELEYDEYLKGKPGRRTLLRDRRGYLRIDVEGVVVPPTDGETLVLTIDLIRQTIMEDELAAGVAEAGALHGSAIAVDPRSGAILAIANVPSFDANAPQSASVSAWRNRAITDRLEPGSAFKMIAASAALETGVTSMDRIVDTGNGTLQLAGYTLNDISKYGQLSFNDVIVKSSNVGMALTTSSMEPTELYEYIRNFGFGQKTWVDLPGEISGFLKRTNLWSQTTKPALSIGYEIDVTPIQLVMAYAALANGGLLRQPYIVAERRDVTGRVLWRAMDDPARTDSIRRVLKEETASKLLPAFIDVVQRGTATEARVEGITVAGKTGTARKTVNGQYGDEYRATFVGFYPAEDPQVAMVVVLDEPQTSIYGGRVSAPIFRRIVERWAVTFPDSGLPFPHEGWQFMVKKNSSEPLPQFEQTTQSSRAAIQATQPTGELTIMPSVLGLDARSVRYLLSSRGIYTQLIGSGTVIEQLPEPGDTIDSQVILQLQ
ncbi:MAG: penicillin-binding transpeptidase domain-containing protein [Bacteroidetes bacterium]|nr:penicillin-binding transpeptidase domain-containing protein [Bacteroidota bacterium]MCY4205089.1 penicillin-binding transpeptidase domain-containing protein [Bacteroidota bacterium]